MDQPWEESGVDYKAMYLRMMRAAEDAIRLLEEAQRECEEMYLAAGEGKD